MGKIKRFTTCTCEWNVSWLPSISEINSIPEFGFFRLKYYLLVGSAFNQFEDPFSELAHMRIFTVAQLVQKVSSLLVCSFSF